MSMYGSYKDSPEKKRRLDEATKGIEDFFSGKTPRKTPEQAKADREAWKQKSMADVKARNNKIKADAIARDKADLPNLEKRHSELSEIVSKGKNWMYADREQNLSDEERKARGASSELQQLSGRINSAKNSNYKQGGKVVKMAYGGSDVDALNKAAYARDIASAAKQREQQAAAQKASLAQQAIAKPPTPSYARAPINSPKVVPKAIPKIVYPAPKAPISSTLGAVNKPRSVYKEGGKVSTHIKSKSSPNW